MCGHVTMGSFGMWDDIIRPTAPDRSILEAGVLCRVCPSFLADAVLNLKAEKKKQHWERHGLPFSSKHEQPFFDGGRPCRVLSALFPMHRDALGTLPGLRFLLDFGMRGLGKSFRLTCERAVGRPGLARKMPAADKTARVHAQRARTLSDLQESARKIRAAHPDRIPVILTMDPRSSLPTPDKVKFLVPRDYTIQQFIFLLRRRLRLPPEKALYVYINRQFPAANQTMKDMDATNRHVDGFLYVTVASESTFGLA